MTGTKALLLVVAVIAVAYGASVRNELVFDDLIFATRDARVQDIGETPRLFVEPLWGFKDNPGSKGVHQYYRPLQLAPLAILNYLFDDPAPAAHLLNLLVHLCNALLVMMISRRLLSNDHAALAVALLFAVHPGHSEAVLWVSDICGLGAAACMLGVVLIHMRGSTGNIGGATAIAVLGFTGLLFKESALLAPLLLLIHDLTLGRDGFGPDRRRLLPYAALAVPLACYTALRLHALEGFLPGFRDHGLGPAALVVNGFALLPAYAATFVWPSDLNMYHDFDAAGGPADIRFLAGISIALLILATSAYFSRTRPGVSFGLLWSLSTAAPYLIVRWPSLNVFAERYLYLPSIGLLWALAFAAMAASRKGRAFRQGLAVAVAAVAAIFITIDIARTYEWRDELTLYTKTLEQSERAELIRNNLALRYLADGRHAEGVELLEGLVAMDPDFADAHHNLGLLYHASGETESALAAFRRAHELAPFKPETLLNMGYVYDSLGRRPEAVEAYFRLVMLEPKSTDGWHNLAVIAYESGQPDNARKAARRVLAIDPSDSSARELLRRLDSRAVASIRPPRGETLQRCEAGKAAAVMGAYQQALVKLNTAAWIDEAAPLPHHYLANVYYLTGRLRKAVLHQRLALERAPGNTLYKRNLESLERELAVLQAGKP